MVSQTQVASNYTRVETAQDNLTLDPQDSTSPYWDVVVSQDQGVSGTFNTDAASQRTSAFHQWLKITKKGNQEDGFTVKE